MENSLQNLQLAHFSNFINKKICSYHFNDDLTCGDLELYQWLLVNNAYHNESRYEVRTASTKTINNIELDDIHMMAFHGHIHMIHWLYINGNRHISKGCLYAARNCANLNESRNCVALLIWYYVHCEFDYSIEEDMKRGITYVFANMINFPIINMDCMDLPTLQRFTETEMAQLSASFPTISWDKNFYYVGILHWLNTRNYKIPSSCIEKTEYYNHHAATLWLKSHKY
jgi:hypothetical protein